MVKKGAGRLQPRGRTGEAELLEKFAMRPEEAYGRECSLGSLQAPNKLVSRWV
jgi:hypothetical protein